MCMLCVIPPHVLPSREKLENSALNNPDGFGFAIAVPKEKRLIVERSMSADESINNFLRLRAYYPEGYAIWHARYATHGTIDIDNCHPFYVGKDNMTILAHNGVLPTEEIKGETRSDTRIFAEDILAKIGGAPALDNTQIYNMLEDFTNGSKVVVLTVDPRAQHEVYLLHENKGNVDESGVWWSNTSYELNYYKPTPKYYYDGYYDTEYSRAWNTESPALLTQDSNNVACKTCEALIDPYELEQCDNICLYCESCQDCLMDCLACMCYKPSRYMTHVDQEAIHTEQVDQFPQEMWKYVQANGAISDFSMQWDVDRRKWVLLDSHAKEISESVWKEGAHNG